MIYRMIKKFLNDFLVAPWLRQFPLKQEKDNPYNYICRFCGQTFITIGELGTAKYDQLVVGGWLCNSECICHKRYPERRTI